jgi:hypothetical protein
MAKRLNLDVQSVRDVLGQVGESEGLTVMVGDDFEKGPRGRLAQHEFEIALGWRDIHFYFHVT